MMTLSETFLLKNMCINIKSSLNSLWRNGYIVNFAFYASYRRGIYFVGDPQLVSISNRRAIFLGPQVTNYYIITKVKKKTLAPDRHN